MPLLHSEHILNLYGQQFPNRHPVCVIQGIRKKLKKNTSKFNKTQKNTTKFKQTQKNTNHILQTQNNTRNFLYTQKNTKIPKSRH